MKTKPLNEATYKAILDATWTLIAEKRRLNVSQADIAKAAGVSRQTVYVAFGNRTGLLMAMVQNKDAQTDHAARLTAISRAETLTAADFRRYIDTWLDYLPLIYPVGILLDAAALTEAEAAAAWDDRMKGALLAGLKRIAKHLAAAGQLAPDVAPGRAAELVWSFIHPANWRLLVEGCGWSEEEFRRSRIDLIARSVMADGAAF